MPDVDASDVEILHGETKEIGYFIKYIIYYTLLLILASKLFNIEKRHRGVMHSLIGLLLTDLILIGIIYVCAIIHSFTTSISFFDIATIPLWIVLGISIGFILHMVEDSFTKSGVRWFLPKKRVISGNLRTFSKEEKKFAEALLLLGAIPLFISLYIGAVLIVVSVIIVELIAAYIYSKYIVESKNSPLESIKKT